MSRQADKSYGHSQKAVIIDSMFHLKRSVDLNVFDSDSDIVIVKTCEKIDMENTKDSHFVSSEDERSLRTDKENSYQIDEAGCEPISVGEKSDRKMLYPADNSETCTKKRKKRKKKKAERDTSVDLCTNELSEQLELHAESIYMEMESDIDRAKVKKKKVKKTKRAKDESETVSKNGTIETFATGIQKVNEETICEDDVAISDHILGARSKLKKKKRKKDKVDKSPHTSHSLNEEVIESNHMQCHVHGKVNDNLLASNVCHGNEFDVEALEVHATTEEATSFCNTTKVGKSKKKKKRTFEENNSEICLSAEYSELLERADDYRKGDDVVILDLENSRRQRKKKKKSKHKDRYHIEEEDNGYTQQNIVNEQENEVLDKTNNHSNEKISGIEDADGCGDEISSADKDLACGKSTKNSRMCNKSASFTTESLITNSNVENVEVKRNVASAGIGRKANLIIEFPDQSNTERCDDILIELAKRSGVLDKKMSSDPEIHQGVFTTDIKTVKTEKKRHHVHKNSNASSAKHSSPEKQPQIYQCSVCDQTFTRKFNKERHEASHKDEMLYACYLCGRNFARADHLSAHELTHQQTVDKPYQCPTCLRSFVRKSHLTDHLLTHSQLKMHECPICQKAFTQKSNCKTHMLTHEKVKKYECATCSKSFTLKHHLKEHELTHQGNKPHQCSICGRSYAQASSLHRHEKQHVGEETDSNCNPVVTVPAKQKQHYCDICGKSYVNKSYMTKHKQSHMI